MSNQVERVTQLQYVFSGDVDHRKMTGGEFDVRKLYRLESSHPELFVHTVALPVTHDSADDTLHKGMHTLEHGLSYDTQGLRHILETMSKGEVKAKDIFDISPYILPDGRVGFRILSAVRINAELFATALKSVMYGFKNFLLKGNAVPFANQEQCGQAGFHDPKRAIDIMEKSLSSRAPFEILRTEKINLAQGDIVAVSDFRLLKPQVGDGADQIFLSPENSHAISADMERDFDTDWKVATASDIQQPKVLRVGTYGCMTGNYPTVITSDQRVVENTDILSQQMHTVMTLTLLRRLSAETNSTYRAEVQQSLDLIDEHNPVVTQTAREALLNSNSSQ